MLPHTSKLPILFFPTKPCFPALVQRARRVGIHNCPVPAHPCFSKFPPFTLSSPRGQECPTSINTTVISQRKTVLYERNSWIPSSDRKQLSSLDHIPSKVGRSSCCGSGPGSGLLWASSPCSPPFAGWHSFLWPLGRVDWSRRDSEYPLRRPLPPPPVLSSLTPRSLLNKKARPRPCFALGWQGVSSSS